MNVDGIRLFILSAKHLNITRAARELHLSQSAASRQLKQLEKDLGTKLLKRYGRGIELTYTGREYLEKIVPIMFQLEDAKRSVGDKNAESLAIGACRGPAAVLLPTLMARLRETHPAIRLTLYPGNSSEAQEWLKASMVDIAIITSPPRSPSFQVEPYRPEPLTAFVVASHPLAKKNARAIELTGVPLIIRAGRPEQTRMESQLISLTKGGRKPTIAMRCGSSRSVKEAVRQGAGVGILYRDAVKQEIDQGEFKAVTIAGLDLERQSYIVYIKEKPLSAITREFLSLLRASASQESFIKTMTPQSSAGRGNRQTGGHILRSKLRY